MMCEDWETVEILARYTNESKTKLINFIKHNAGNFKGANSRKYTINFAAKNYC